MKTALMVAEKPSLAASLANILSNGRCSTRKGVLTIRIIFPFHVFSFFFINIASRIERVLLRARVDRPV